MRLIKMAQKPPVKIPQGVWVNLYVAANITVGNKLVMHNNGSNLAIISDSLTEPLPGAGYDNLQPDEWLTTSTYPTQPDGAWAFSARGTTLQISEAV